MKKFECSRQWGSKTVYFALSYPENPCLKIQMEILENECIPLAARRLVNQKGEITEEKHEPAAADLRKMQMAKKFLAKISCWLGWGGTR